MQEPATDKKETHAPQSILIYEKDARLGMAIATSVWAQTHMQPEPVRTVCQGLTDLQDRPNAFFAAAINVEDPNALPLLEKVMQQSIPAIVYAEEFEDNDREKLPSWGIAYTVVSRREELAEAVGKAFGQLAANRYTTILIADDSRSMRMALARFLKTRCHRILQACDGKEALELLAANPETQLVITDYEMPNVDGYSLVKTIRQQHSKDDLAVIGISAKTNSLVSVKFINSGANDFLHKPFLKEELYCRVEHNIEMLERIKLIRDLSYRDSLTKLHNRRYFFKNAEDFLEQATKNGQICCVGMIDIDHFKVVNDTYGHDAGDIVLQKVSSIIANRCEDNAIVSRFGGEEFCVLYACDSTDQANTLFDGIRNAIEISQPKIEEKTISVTISTGVCCDPGSLETMLKVADARLYIAKKGGRNKVVYTTPKPNIRSRR